ncbi:MAG: hypothetical protein ACTSQI_09935 [Candidatus Helarchaeota archaeon]
MKKISQEFSEFVRRIIETSKLQVIDGKLSNAFEQELILRKESIKVFFQTIFSIYDEWTKSTLSTFISDFIHHEGLSIFSVWLAEVYPFEFDRIEIDCPKGPSHEDVLLNIAYRYNKVELDIIRNFIVQYGLNVDDETVAKLLFIEAIKSSSKILSEAIEDEYKIFTEEVSTEFIDFDLLIKYRGAGRVVK